MKTLPRFWSALDALPGAATDARDWRMRLGEEWPLVERYLRRTGHLATAVDCPSPGGDGCPRTVVLRTDGGARAVCGCSPSLCEPLELDRDDLLILVLDRPRLAVALAEILASPATMAPLSPAPRVVPIGRHAVAAGVACEVVLVLPGPGATLNEDDLRDAGLAGAQRGVVLVPTDRSLLPPAMAWLRAAGHQVLALSEALVTDGSGELRPVQPVDVLLAPAREPLLARLAPAWQGLSWALPADARWSELTFRLQADETILCAFRGETRPLDPAFFGMRNARNHKPTASWTVLKALAMGRGSAPIADPAQEAAVQKRFQLLGKAMVEAFGIQPSPIRWDKGDHCYRAEFVISDERPTQARG